MSILGTVGSLGRSTHDLAHSSTHFFAHASGVWRLFVQTLYFSFVAPFTRRTELRKQLCPMMSNVGVRSFPICALTTFLMGAILVLQSGEPLRRFGQIQEVLHWQSAHFTVTKTVFAVISANRSGVNIEMPHRMRCVCVDVCAGV